MTVNMHSGPTRYGWMCWLPHDEYVGRSLELYGEFSVGEVMVFAQLVDKQTQVIEIGANIGAHTLALSQLALEVGAYEPQKLLHWMLCANVQGCDNVLTEMCAVGNENDTIAMPNLTYADVGNYGAIGCKGWLNRFSKNLTYEVPIIKLDDSPFVNGVDFIKIDVEGMELEVLQGGKEMVGDFKPTLYVENDRPEKSAALIDYIRQFGYKLYWHCPPLYNGSNFNNNPEDVFQNTVSVNMVALDPSRWECVSGVSVEGPELPLGIILSQEHMLPQFKRVG